MRLVMSRGGGEEGGGGGGGGGGGFVFNDTIEGPRAHGLCVWL